MRHRPRLRSLGRRLLFPRPAAVLACVLAAALGLGWVFRAGGQDSPLAYGAYALSAYALAVLCAGAARWGRALAARVGRIPLVARFRGDLTFRAAVTLYASLAVNLLYAGMNAVSGVRSRSAWFVTLAVYYLFLAVMRFALVRYTRRAAPGSFLAGERRRARFCGVLLAAMNVALAGVVNLVRTRRYRSPVLSAWRAVSLASALVSMLALEVAMLDRFGSPEDTLFRTGMIAGSGLGVCAIVAGLGLSMAVRKR